MPTAVRSKASDSTIKRPFARENVVCPFCSSKQTMWFSVFSRFDESKNATVVIDDYRCLNCGDFIEVHTIVTV